MRNGLGILGGLALLVMIAVPAGATTVTLTDLNSTAYINADDQAGMTDWYVDGGNYLYQQWFWYRIGDNSGELPINTISAATIAQLDAATAKLIYSNGIVEVTVLYGLLGGSPGSSVADIAETIRVKNLTDQALDFHFFQYSDFDLASNLVDTVEMHGHEHVSQTAADGSIAVSETVVTPTPDHVELGYFANTLNSLNDGLPTTLNDVTSAGPGDVTWAFQWDVTIGAGGTFIISKDKQLIIPEPLTMVSGFLAISGLGMYLRRRTSLKA